MEDVKKALPQTPSSAPEIPSDADLLRRAQKNDREALSELIQRRQTFVYEMALRVTYSQEEAEDVTQEAIIGFIETVPRLDPEKVNLRAWLGGIVVKCSRFRRRGSVRRRQREMTVGKIQAQAEALGGEVETNKEQKEILRRELSRLPEKYRLPLQMRFWDDCSLEDISQCLQLHEKTVAKHIKRGLLELRRQMSRAGFSAAPAALAVTLQQAAATASMSPELAGHLARLAHTQAFKAGVAVESLRVASLNSTKLLVGAVVLTAVSVTVVGAYLHVERNNNAGKNTAANVLDAPNPLDDENLFARWTFEKGPADDLKVVYGEWEWWPADENDPACMAASPDNTALVFLPQKITVPVMLTVLGSNIHYGVSGRTGVSLSDGKTLFPCTVWGNPPSDNAKALHIYVWNGYVATIDEHRNIVSIAEVEGAEKADRLALVLVNTMVHTIELRRLVLSDLPEPLRNPRETVANFRLAPKKIEAIKLDAHPYQPRPLQHHKWTFENGPHPQIAVLEGKWDWKPAARNVPATWTPSSGAADKPAYALLPARLSLRPFVVSFHLEGVRKAGPGGVFSGWFRDGKTTASGSYPNRIWFPGRVGLDGTQAHVMRVYFHRKYVLGVINNEITRLVKFDAPCPSGQVYFGGRNFRISAVELHELDPAELPEALRDPEKTIRKLGVDPVNGDEMQTKP